jgi:hypothetical protein
MLTDALFHESKKEYGPTEKIKKFLKIGFNNKEPFSAPGCKI